MDTDRHRSKKALLVIDVQNDFLPGGALAVPEGDVVIPVINELIEGDGFDFIVATQDWHPADHGSFAANHEGRKPGDHIELNGLDQTLWPVHCVEGTPGAEFSPSLNTKAFDAVFQKGANPEIDSYSGFFDNGHRRSTGLGAWLRDRGVTELTLVGLATDYCVKFTALDAVNEGFDTIVRAEACRGVNLNAADVGVALEKLRERGVRVVERGPDGVLVETLYRPTGENERRLLEESGYQAWPPRLPEQPIFYPVTNRRYAREIAERWNTTDDANGNVGHVTCFRTETEHLSQFERQQVGASHHTEYWVPAESLEEFNRHLVGPIEVIETFERQPIEA